MTGPEEMRAAGTDLARQRDTYGAAIESASASLPWGDDEYGAAFAGRYHPVERQVMDAWKQLAGYVTSLGEKS